MKFKKYGSIEGAHRIKTVNYIIETGNSDGDWISLLKIHGANYSLWSDGEEVKRAKRSAFVEGQSFYGDHTFDYTEKVLSMFEYIKFSVPEMEVLTICGEIYGGKYDHPDVEKVKEAKQIQKEVQYRPDNDFIVFDIKIDNKLVNHNMVEKLCALFGFDTVPVLGVGTFSELMEMPVVFPDPLYKGFDFPEIEGNMAEGWVLKPVEPKFFGNGERIILKGKNPSQMENTGKNRDPKPVYEMSDEGNRLLEELMTFFNENRLRNVLSHGDIEEITQKDFGRIVGMLCQDAFGDFSKDNGVAYEALPKKEKKILKKRMNQEGGNVIRPNFLNIIDGEF